MFVDLEWTSRPIKTPYQETVQLAKNHFSQLTTNQGCLGRLEELAIRLAGLQRRKQPLIDPARVVIFAADHGFASESICALPQAATRSMVYDCMRGYSPIARMVRQLEVDLELVDVGMIAAPETSVQPVLDPKSTQVRFIEQAVAAGTADFRYGSAMTHEQISVALRVGRDAVKRAIDDGKRLFIGGDIGVGSIISANVIASILLKIPAEYLTGSGKSELSAEKIPRVAAVIQKGFDVHEPFHDKAIETLRRLGGFEIAALTGAFIACGQRGVPAVVDGFVATTAALVAISLHPPLKEWLIFAHRSAEPGQLLILQSLNIQPLIDLNMQWGEATGAVAVLPLLRLAGCLLQDEV